MAKPLGRGPAPRLGESERAVLRQLVAADNYASLAEYGARLAAQTGISVVGRCCASPSSVWAWCAQQKTLRASEQGRADVVAERTAFVEAVRTIAPENLVFLDESGISTKLIRLYARAPRGERAYGTAPGPTGIASPCSARLPSAVWSPS